MKKLYLLFVVFYMSHLQSFSQKGPSVEWSKLYGGSNAEAIYTIESLSNGGYIAAGYTASTNGDILGKNTAGNDWWIVELDNQGNMVRQAVYGTTGVETIINILPLEDGGYIVNGNMAASANQDFSGVSGKGGVDILIAKLNDTLGIEWTKNIGGTGNETLYDMKKTTDGGYIACGFTSSLDGDIKNKLNGTNDDWWIIKFDADFAIQYEKTYGGSGPASLIYQEYANSIIQLQNGNYAVVGITSSVDGDLTGNGIDKNDGTVVMLDNELGIVWAKTFGGAANDEFHNIIQMSDGNLIIAGQTLSSDGTMEGMIKGGSDIWLMKIAPDGEIFWSELFGGTGNERSVAISESLIEVEDEGVVYIGLTNKADGDVSWLSGGDNAGYDAWMIRLSKEGAIQWEKTFGGPTGNGTSFDYIHKIMKQEDGTFILAGRSNSTTGGDITTNSGNYDAWFLKLRSCPERIAQSASVCENEAYDFNGTILTEAGEYTDTLLAVGGCDSIITLTLQYLPAYTTVRDIAVCAGETYDFYGQSVSEGGSYIHVLKSVKGCDSTISLRFTVNALPFPELVSDNNILSTGSVYAQYEWFYNDMSQEGTNRTFEAKQTGYYRAVVTDLNNCTDTSASYFAGIPSTDAFELEGRYIWKFTIPGMGNQVSVQEYHGDRIEYRMTGNVYANEYSMEMESYDTEEGRWIGVGSGGSSIVKDGMYYVLFFRDYRGDSVLVYKHECDSREEAYVFDYPSEDAVSDYGWNWYVRDPGTGLYNLNGAGLVNLYPNPVQSMLQIAYPFTGSVSIRLLDPYGRLVQESEESGSMLLDMSACSSGIYLLQIYENNIHQYTERIIKR